LTHHNITNRKGTYITGANSLSPFFLNYQPDALIIPILFCYKLAFKTTNTLQQLTKQKQTSSKQELDKSGIYKLLCNAYHMAYVGQTNRHLKQRYQKHIRYIRHNNPQSAYSQHILNNRHEYGPYDNTMSLLKHINNTSMLVPYEQLYIQTLLTSQTAYFRTKHRWTQSLISDDPWHIPYVTT
jgi:hypothetical protein